MGTYSVKEKTFSPEPPRQNTSLPASENCTLPVLYTPLSSPINYVCKLIESKVKSKMFLTLYEKRMLFPVQKWV